MCQEIELLRGYSVQPDDSLIEEGEDETFNDEEDEISSQSIPDPELEILHFEESEFPEDIEFTKEEEENVVYNAEDEEADEEDLTDEENEEDVEEEENSEEEDLTSQVEEEEESVDEIEHENDEDELEESDFNETDEDEINLEDEEDEDIEKDTPVEEPAKAGATKTFLQPDVREMNIDELGDEDEEPMQFSPLSGSGSSQVMHEIPKPEVQEPEKQAASEAFQKDRSLNDVIGENKSEETILGNGPIPNLRAAIGLNDRFLFIREIFNNNTDKFNTVIDQLDRLETIQQAVDYLRVNLTLEKNDTSLRFVELLKRRFVK